MYTDPIADMLTRIRNAARARHTVVRMPASREKQAILEIMAQNGFIEKVTAVKTGKFSELEVALFPEKTGIMLSRVSKPGQRRYVSATQIRPVRSGYGIGIISTSQGIMTTSEAKKRGIGGEYICELS